MSRRVCGQVYGQVYGWWAAAHRVSTLVEPYAGSGVVGLHAVLSGAVARAVLVDRDELVVHAWRMILRAGPTVAERYARVVRAGWGAVRELLDGAASDDVDEAVAVLLRGRVAYGGGTAPRTGVPRAWAARTHPDAAARRVRALWALSIDDTPAATGVLSAGGVGWVRVRRRTGRPGRPELLAGRPLPDL